MTKLRVLDAEPVGGSIVALLDEALEKANAGELSSVAVAWIERDGCADWDWSEAPNSAALIGSIERMKAALIREAEE